MLVVDRLTKQSQVVDMVAELLGNCGRNQQRTIFLELRL